MSLLDVGEVWIRTRVEVPRPPNFIRMIGPEVTVDVAELSDEELRAIGAAWTEALIVHAMKRRDE